MSRKKGFAKELLIGKLLSCTFANQMGLATAFLN